ncbi:hypothetical protein LOC68_16390 [Blastopirellula sp. JC732]|uniref:Lipoprotein n=1 Tax=Blastopirellula sediminis TaxID=2894196 RepID=A0A9X1MPC8_9BACT|nr:hypothetical protein [Blastopirellula sediminis]MCC9606731.1 hypothetical protein [Blastopirellula sediminis]MCC9629972.1 hypothetical protein [Blastopirellula sediminis]
MKFARLSLIPFCVFALAGCSAEQPTPPSPAASTATTTAAKPEEPELPLTLAPAGLTVPPLDQGRYQTTLPDGWRFLPRRSEYLIGAYEDQPSGIPRILAHVSDSPLEDVVDEPSAKVLYKQLAEEIGELTFVYPPPKVIEIGSNFWVQYCRPAKFQSEAARQLVLETVHNGRRYKLELYVDKNDLASKVGALYRMANDSQFHSEEAKPMDEAPAEEPTADEKS